MEDLLKEDDFIKKLPQHNPWKAFTIFYIIAFIKLILFIIITRSMYGNDVNEMALAFVILISPILLSFIMIFYRKEHQLLPLKTVALAISLIMMVYLLTLISIGIYYNFDNLLGNENILMISTLLGGYLLLFVICSAIILPIIKRNQKRVLLTLK